MNNFPRIIIVFIYPFDCTRYLFCQNIDQAAIDNLEAMLNPSLGVDAVLIGPHDLSCNLGDYQDALMVVLLVVMLCHDEQQQEF